MKRYFRIANQVLATRKFFLKVNVNTSVQTLAN